VSVRIVLKLSNTQHLNKNLKFVGYAKMPNYFVPNIIPELWEGELELSTIKGIVDWRKTLSPLPCGDGLIPIGYRYNGASVGPLRGVFPKWKHPIATGRHDWRCGIADTYKKSNPDMYHKLRKFADDQFKIDVAVGGNWWEVHAGYAAVRIGAYI
jgi:hypothetical protein